MGLDLRETLKSVHGLSTAIEFRVFLTVVIEASSHHALLVVVALPGSAQAVSRAAQPASASERTLDTGEHSKTLERDERGSPRSRLDRQENADFRFRLHHGP